MQSTRLDKFTVFFEQSEEFHTLKREIFSQDLYYVEIESPAPIIIDAGAHIGLATLYFKKLYPQAKIWAIEPLKENFLLLEKNCMENFLEDVTCIQVALTSSGTQTTLYADHTDIHWLSTAGSQPGSWNGQQSTTPRTVPALQLSTLLQDIHAPIDLLKMDIEGNEWEVLKEAQDSLRKIEQMMIEYHPVRGQSLSDIVKLLTDRGFNVLLWKDGKEVVASRAKGLVLIQASRK